MIDLQYENSELHRQLRIICAHLTFSEGRRSLNAKRLRDSQSHLRIAIDDIHNISEQYRHGTAVGTQMALSAAGFHTAPAIFQLTNFAGAINDDTSLEDVEFVQTPATAEDGSDLEIVSFSVFFFFFLCNIDVDQTLFNPLLPEWRGFTCDS